ncbi:phosphate ABC transporter permease PstA [Pseudoteredinibacter isoporae]|uniref:Phosphate transport system permease protein PstA n=1 Tax=Pseudoteredinibacter isoporae TaxID=570281 RepID=A0A7X0JR71_9GAMM|nr:phosphate ABC transporter permease PstA [Pseudoteredinibacter isoporae]MBB6520289.1 phosphate transport system permease protein [Pseudoteredinibacter isoporae]NHO85860.1 phosphate ABC transporter permease PstA [Pseudoteredinibacter isoporae]NIB25688.1 phosphate ABC transporter permease PstA [Pseudoteredinibacter isoporae]
MNSTEKMNTIDLVNKNLAKRYRAEKRFKAYGIASITFGMICLVFLFTDIIGKGYTAFVQSYIKLEITLDADTLDISDPSDPNQIAGANYMAAVKKSLRERFPDVSGRRDKRTLYKLVSNGSGFDLRKMLEADPSILNTTQTVWLIADDDIDTYIKSTSKDGKAFTGRMNEMQQAWVKSLEDNGEIETRFNTVFFTNGDSREPEQAGIRGAIMGSLFTMLVTLILSFPIGVAAAVYLEEYAPKNKWTDLIEVNINNLAAVPSIIFGLLGVAIFIGMFGMQRSLPLVGGMVLTLMTLPTIIISSRAAIKAVPPSIREAALGIGASKMQMILHHVLPLAMPGMLTGAIIGLAQALGETAPLLMIGMVAFIVDIPGGVSDPATVLPVQIFLWSDSPERAFVERTSAAIMVLLGFLIVMNALAVWLRKRLERRW